MKKTSMRCAARKNGKIVNQPSQSPTNRKIYSKSTLIRNDSNNSSFNKMVACVLIVFGFVLYSYLFVSSLNFVNPPGFVDRERLNPNDTLLISTSNEDVKIYSIDENILEIIPHIHNPPLQVVAESQDPVLSSIYKEKLATEINLSKPTSKKIQTADRLQQWGSIFRNIEDTNDDSTQSLFSKKYESDENMIPFTQGLLLTDRDTFLESAGLYGGSILREASLHTGETLRYVRLPDSFFGEGCTLIRVDIPTPHCNSENYSGDSAMESAYYDIFVLQLTWKNKIMIVYKFSTLEPILWMKMSHDGWGLASNFSWENVDEMFNQRIWATSGDIYLYELDAKFIANKIKEKLCNGTHQLESGLANQKEEIPIIMKQNVFCLGASMRYLNELEYDAQKNAIYGNIFGTFLILELNPDTGVCSGIISMQKITKLQTIARKSNDDVFNGISTFWKFNEGSNQAQQFFLVTGKRWENLYILALKNLNNLARNPIQTWRDLRNNYPFFFH